MAIGIEPSGFGAHVAWACAIESGKYNPSAILALKIAHVFNCSVNDIFELEESDWQSKTNLLNTA